MDKDMETKMRYTYEEGTKYTFKVKTLAWTLISIAALVVIYIFIKVTWYLP